MRILCFGDSNTHGHNPNNNTRWEKDKRYTGVLSSLLGSDDEVIEEGLGGRTISFDNPFEEGMKGLDYLYPCLMSHKKIDLLVVMLGTNDCQTIYNANAHSISKGLSRLIKKAKSTTEAFVDNKPQILIISPVPLNPSLKREMPSSSFNEESIEKSRMLAKYYKQVAKENDCLFLDTSNKIEVDEADCIHLNETQHKALAHLIYNEVKNIKDIKVEIKDIPVKNMFVD